MPYRRSNYDFVIDSSFQPFSMQEMLVPFTAYKEAYEKDEAAYQDLTDRADTFKYLARRLEDNQDSESARIYKGYADELNRQAQDLANNGLTMSGRRGLTNLKRRYQGEIGRLVTADAAMKEEQKLRRANKDNSMLYAQDNLDIDDFLDGKTPNLYSISGNELYTRGAQAGKTASSRVYNTGDEGSTLGGYYRKWVERNGYSKESMDAFRANASAIPELQQAADAILAERGVNENLSGNNLERARQSVINGIIDGSVYQESVKPVRDAGVMSAQEQDASKRAWAADSRAAQQMELSALQSGYRREGNKWVFDPEIIKKRQESLGIPGYNPDEWEVGPDGKARKKSNSTAKQTPEEKQENAKQKALLKLDKGALAHNGGFDVQFGDDRHHYNYIGAISRHGDKWHTGGIGEDNPGHGGLRGWGFGSTSNVENMWGNFSAEGSDSKEMRVLSPDEMMRLVSSDNELLDAIQKRAEAMNIDPEKADIQLIEVPNEKGGGGGKGYLIAVH